MIVYKIRDKATGLFLNRNGYKSTRGGRVYTNIGHIKTSFNKSWSKVYDDNLYELVELELVEKQTILVSTLK